MRSLTRSLFLLALPTAAAAQGEPRVMAALDRPPAARGTVGTMASAVRAERAPLLDGRGTDAVWASAPAITDFRVFDPGNGEVPRLRTSAQVAYDEKNLYVLVHAFDTAPDSIRGLLSRRDVRTPSDWIRVMVDSYHDKRTGYEFIVNPVGVKRDVYIFGDGNEDVSWDAVWDVQTSIDSTGWTAEFRIPWSQLRYPATAEHTIGLMVAREVARTNERHSWPFWDRQKAGFTSQFGDVSGIRGLPNKRRAELMPYVVQKEFNRERGARDGWVHRGQLSVGADVKYGLTSNLTLDATFNPDFGQVEADPATYNLTTTENYFAERRPFFMEGMGIFRFDLNCNDGDCTGLFYSRRIGAAPRLGGAFGDESTPVQTTILGAAKLTGRTNSGLSLGVLNAVTQKELGAPILDDTGAAHGDRYVVEPMTNYFVGRAQQELRGGNTVIGTMLTSTVRDLDDVTARYLRRQALAGGLDFSHRFAAKRYELQGYFAGSRVDGSEAAIARTQSSYVHLYQREGSGLGLDTTRTYLSGETAQLFLNKVGGFLRFSTGYNYTSPGFEINDAGFLGRADQQAYSNWAGLRWIRPRGIYNMVGLNFNQWTVFNAAGERIDMGGNVNAHSQLKNGWFVHGGWGVGQFASYNDRDARGGPAFRRSPNSQQWAGFETDGRKPISGWLNANHYRGDYGRSRVAGAGFGVVVRPSSRYSVTLNPRFDRWIDDSQWFGVVTQYDDASETTGTDRYVFAHMDQKVLRTTLRMDFSATPTLSLQLYASPFVTSGHYTDLRGLSEDPRSKDYETRFTPLLKPNGDGTFRQMTSQDLAYDGFNYKQFNSNTVLRWEYRPGSALYLVWAQGRIQDDRNPGSFDMQRDARDLFRAHPGNTFIIKGSYWLSL